MKLNDKMITDYEVISEYSPKILADKVNKLLQEGWQLRGDLFCTFNRDFFVQVMVKTS